MMPYQWLRTDSGQFQKLDCATHGDNHFFPGPVDAAWDLAGTIVEGEMDDAAREHFLKQYADLTTDNVTVRIAAYELAYVAFRNGYCRMASAAMKSVDPGESQRLARDARKYAGVMERWCPEKALAGAVYE